MIFWSCNLLDLMERRLSKHFKSHYSCIFPFIPIVCCGSGGTPPMNLRMFIEDRVRIGSNHP